MKTPFCKHFFTCWNATIAQITLKDNNNIDAMCPTDSSTKYVLLPVSVYKWQVLKIKILGKYDFPN